jgi:hypothetical protein
MPLGPRLIDPIGIDDTYGEAYNLIMRFGAREQMIRELLKNAEEAARQKPVGERLIRIYGTNLPQFGRTRKLAIWNRGGMSLSEFRRFANINVAINKTNSPDDNFGRGAKIASLSSNKLGMRYRSCHGGRVLEVVLAVEEASRQVGRVEVSEGTPIQGDTCIRDVTYQYRNLQNSKRHPEFRLDQDWTEVVLFGNVEDQDTTQRPYLDLDLPAGDWIFRTIGLRFIRLSEGIDLKIHSSITRYHPTPYWMGFDAIEDSLSRAHQHSIVPFDGGRIYYIQARSEDGGTNIRSDASREGKGFAPYYGGEKMTFGGIVHKGEIYYLNARGYATPTSKHWPRLALDWGIVNAYNKVSVLIELDDDVVYTNQTRTALFDASTRVEIDPSSYGHIVRDNRPQWLIDLDETPGDNERTRIVRDRLRDLMRRFRLQIDGVVRDRNGDERLEGDDRSGGGKHRRQGSPNPEPWPPRPRPPGDDQPHNRPGVTDRSGLIRAKRKARFRDAPDPQWMDQAWFDEQQLTGMAALWQPPTASQDSMLFLNKDHDRFKDLRRRLAEKAPEAAPEGRKHELATTEAKALLELVVGTRVVGALVMEEEEIIDEPTLRAQVLTPAALTSEFITAFTTREFAEAAANIRRAFRSYRTPDLDEAA